MGTFHIDFIITSNPMISEHILLLIMASSTMGQMQMILCWQLFL